MGWISFSSSYGPIRSAVRGAVSPGAGWLSGSGGELCPLSAVTLDCWEFAMSHSGGLSGLLLAFGSSRKRKNKATRAINATEAATRPRITLVFTPIWRRWERTTRMGCLVCSCSVSHGAYTLHHLKRNHGRNVRSRHRRIPGSVRKRYRNCNFVKLGSLVWQGNVQSAESRPR